MAINIHTPADVQRDLARRARDRRLSLNWTQEGLSRRSGVSLGSLKRFEKTGEISLKSLLHLALVLDALGEWDAVFKVKPLVPASLDDLFKTPARARRKGRIT